jgi:hypothetical protein
LGCNPQAAKRAGSRQGKPTESNKKDVEDGEDEAADEATEPKEDAAEIPETRMPVTEPAIRARHAGTRTRCTTPTEPWGVGGSPEVASPDARTQAQGPGVA